MEILARHSTLLNCWKHTSLTHTTSKITFAHLHTSVCKWDRGWSVNGTRCPKTYYDKKYYVMYDSQSWHNILLSTPIPPNPSQPLNPDTGLCWLHRYVVIMSKIFINWLKSGYIQWLLLSLKRKTIRKIWIYVLRDYLWNFDRFLKIFSNIWSHIACKIYIMDLVFWIRSKKLFCQNILKINLGRLSPLKNHGATHTSWNEFKSIDPL